MWVCVREGVGERVDVRENVRGKGVHVGSNLVDGEEGHATYPAAPHPRLSAFQLG
jgi:hypothetical protein